MPELLLVLFCVIVRHINNNKVAKINHKLNKIKFNYRKDNERAHMGLSTAAGIVALFRMGNNIEQLKAVKG